MDDGRIVGQGTYQEMEKIKEFKEIMDINNLNKNVDDDKASDKGSAEGDTETEDDVSEDEGNTNEEERADLVHQMIKKNSSARATALKSQKSKKEGTLAKLV